MEVTAPPPLRGPPLLWRYQALAPAQRIQGEAGRQAAPANDSENVCDLSLPSRGQSQLVVRPTGKCRLRKQRAAAPNNPVICRACRHIGSCIATKKQSDKDQVVSTRLQRLLAATRSGTGCGRFRQEDVNFSKSSVKGGIRMAAASRKGLLLQSAPTCKREYSRHEVLETGGQASRSLRCDSQGPLSAPNLLSFKSSHNQPKCITSPQQLEAE